MLFFATGLECTSNPLGRHTSVVAWKKRAISTAYDMSKLLPAVRRASILGVLGLTSSIYRNAGTTAELGGVAPFN